MPSRTNNNNNVHRFPAAAAAAALIRTTNFIPHTNFHINDYITFYTFGYLFIHPSTYAPANTKFSSFENACFGRSSFSMWRSVMVVFLMLFANHIFIRLSLPSFPLTYIYYICLQRNQKLMINHVVSSNIHILEHTRTCTHTINAKKKKKKEPLILRETSRDIW